MCGLVGLAGPILTHKDVNAFKTLFHLDVLRGDHSSGIGVVYDAMKDKETLHGVLKAVGKPDDLYNSYKDFFNANQTLDPTDLNAVLGHNRYKTHGAITVENAHPFEFDNIIGMHNGVVQMHSMKDFHEASKWPVDSQVIFSHLNHTGDIQDVWDKAEGNMALVWWDKVRDTVNMVRNSQRPLYVTLSEHGDKVYWASESWMLAVALGRADIKHGKLIELPVDSLHTFSLGKKTVDLEVRELNPFVKKVVTYHTGYVTRQPVPAVKVKITGIDTGALYLVGEDEGGIKYRIGYTKPVESYALARVNNDVMYNLTYSYTTADKWVDEFPKSGHYVNLTPITAANTNGGTAAKTLYPIDVVITEYVNKTTDTSYLTGQDKAGKRYKIWVTNYQKEKAAQIELMTKTYRLIYFSNSYIANKAWDFTSQFDNLKEPLEVPKNSEEKEAEDTLNPDGTKDIFHKETSNFEGYNGKIIPKHEWLTLTADGCTICQGAINAEFQKHVFWEDYWSPVCHECVLNGYESQINPHGTNHLVSMK